MWRCAARWGGLLLLTTLWIGVALADPPFDCSMAREASEVAICDSPSLAALDRQMVWAYKDKVKALLAAGKLDEADQLRIEQRQFLRNRNLCSDDTPCLTAVYKSRIQELGRP